MHVYTKSTTPLAEEMRPTTLLWKSSSVPPLVATRSLWRWSTSTPSNFSRFTEASASASGLEILPCASSAACESYQYSRDMPSHQPRTQATSNLVLRALHCSSIPIPTVTLYLSRAAIALSLLKGGPGSLFAWLGVSVVETLHTTHILLDSHFPRERPWKESRSRQRHSGQFPLARRCASAAPVKVNWIVHPVFCASTSCFRRIKEAHYIRTMN